MQIVGYITNNYFKFKDFKQKIWKINKIFQIKSSLIRCFSFLIFKCFCHCFSHRLYIHRVYFIVHLTFVIDTSCQHWYARLKASFCQSNFIDKWVQLDVNRHYSLKHSSIFYPFHHYSEILFARKYFTIFLEEQKNEHSVNSLEFKISPSNSTTVKALPMKCRPQIWTCPHQRVMKVIIWIIKQPMFILPADQLMR